MSIDATPSSSEYNRARIVQYIYNQGEVSRADIARAVQLTPAAVTKITARLIDDQLIRETGSQHGEAKRRAIGLAVDSEHKHVLAIKFARSIVQIGVFDLHGNALSTHTLPPVTNATVHDTLQTLHQYIHDLLSSDPDIRAIGLAVPGPYLRNIGRTAVVSSMQQWQDVNFIDEFAKAYNLPVYIEQDARAGALAEYLWGEHPHTNNLAYYLLGEGIGLGVIERAELIHGAAGTATEIGHISIDIHGRACECGNQGCLERYTSAVAIHDDINANPTLIENSADLTHREVINALCDQAAQSNQEAISYLHAIGEYIGYGCVNIINAFNPERIILGDMIAQAGRYILPAVHAVINQRVIADIAKSTEISISSLPSDAALAGAAAVAVTHLLEQPSLLCDPTRIAK